MLILFDVAKTRKVRFVIVTFSLVMFRKLLNRRKVVLWYIRVSTFFKGVWRYHLLFAGGIVQIPHGLLFSALCSELSFPSCKFISVINRTSKRWRSIIIITLRWWHLVIRISFRHHVLVLSSFLRYSSIRSLWSLLMLTADIRYCLSVT